MPTQTKSTGTKTSQIDESVEAAAERVAELNEKTVANGRKAGAAYLNSYERAVLALADTYQRAADATRVDWIAEVATTQADFTREVTKAYTSAVRDLVAS